MSKKTGTELFIARRIWGGGAVRRIAVATTAVGVAVMIVAVAVIMGFRGEITSRIGTFAGHLRVHAPAGYGVQQALPITLDAELESSLAALGGVRIVKPYGLRGGILKTDGATQGVVLKGVTDSLSGRDILVSASVARMLRLAGGERVEMLFVGGERAVRRDLYKLKGTYTTGLGEMDDRFVITDLGNLRRLNGWAADEASGYEIVLSDIGRLDEVQRRAEALAAKNPNQRLVVSSMVDDNPQLFDWMATHDVNAAVVITIMITVALIACVSAVLIILLERIKMIGILKTLGMRTAALRRVFLLCAARILGVGVLIGTAVGVGLSLVQKYTGVLTLDPSEYFLPAVPIRLHAWWIAALGVGTFVVILALLVLPTSIIGRITPEKTIRYE